MLSSDTITATQFDSALLRYPVVLKALSASRSKTGRGDGESLEDLDWFRFMSAPNRYMRREGDVKDVPLERDDVVRLVKWKLKHGKFRPNLLKLVSTNTPQSVVSTSLAAFAMKDTVSSLRTLALLTGIGPATASLLLSVHDPDNVIFFSDEAYRWLVFGGKEQPIKYNMKEYEQLEVKAKALMERLGVGARDVERAAFVIMRGGMEEITKETAADVQNARTTPSQRTNAKKNEGEDSPEVEHAETVPTVQKSHSTTGARQPRNTSAENSADATEKPIANTKKSRSVPTHSEGRQRSQNAALRESEIPDPKTLARRASQRLRDARDAAAAASPPTLERQCTAEEKLETVIEDLKCKGASLARVVSPPPLRYRRHSRVIAAGDSGRAETEKSTESAEPAAQSPLLGKRNASPKEKAVVRTEEGTDKPSTPQSAAAKRPRRGRSEKGDDADPDAAAGESVGCAAGCLQMLVRPGSR